MIDVPDPPRRYEPPDEPSPFCGNCGMTVLPSGYCPSCGHTRGESGAALEDERKAAQEETMRLLLELKRGGEEYRMLRDRYERAVLDRYDEDF